MKYAKKSYLNDPKWKKSLQWARRAWSALEMDAVQEEKDLKLVIEGIQDEVLITFCLT